MRGANIEIYEDANIDTYADIETEMISSLGVGTLYPDNIYGHIKMGTEL